jgi:2-polyprenyl-6-methoxyphenol hydroxylase-like FAD-dependent oxidoreductase
VSVLIVGGSLVGLSTALFLRLHGVDCLSVERHSGTAIHPRAGHFQFADGRDPALGGAGG